MSTFIVTTKTKEDEALLAQLLKKLHFKAKVLSDEEKEDMGLAHYMKEVDRSEVVSKDSIMAKLGRK